jgi:hypothetical protein
LVKVLSGEEFQGMARGDKAWKGREPVPGVRRTISLIKPVMI